MQSSGPEGGIQPAGGIRVQLLAGLGLVLLVLLAYATAVQNPFVYDDEELVLQRHSVRALDTIPEQIGFTDRGFLIMTRWTRDVGYTLIYAIAGADPRAFHLVNILLHAAVAFLLWQLARRMTGSDTVAFWAAALFAVHPLHTEVVAHISGLRGLLAALFSLLFVILLLDHVRNGGVWRLVAAFPVFYLAAFSKELAVMAVPAGLVAAAWLHRSAADERDGAPGSIFRDAWRFTRSKPFTVAAVVVLFAVITSSLLFFAWDMPNPGSTKHQSFYETDGPGVGPLDRIRMAGVGFRLLLLPVRQTVDYSFEALQMTSAGVTPLAAVDIFLALGFIGLAVHGLWRRTWFGFAGIWFVLFYMPHAGLIAWHEVLAERFFYLPSIGIFLAVPAVLVPMLSRPAWRRGLTAGACMAVLVLGVATLQRSRAWSGPEALWGSAVKAYPRAARAHKALADHYLDEARPELALRHYRSAAEILPRYQDAHLGVVTVLTAQRKFLPAIDYLDGVLEQRPDDPKALNAKALLLESTGKPDAARDIYRKIVDLNPAFAQGYNNLAKFHVNEGDVEGAIALYEKALEVDPSFTTAMLNLGTVYRHGLENEERARYYEDLAREVTGSREN